MILIYDYSYDYSFMIYCYYNDYGYEIIHIHIHIHTHTHTYTYTYIARACFNPEAAVTMWQKMETIDTSNKGLAKYLSTHPSHSDRISQTKGWLDEALKEREKYCKHSNFSLFSRL